MKKIFLLLFFSTFIQEIFSQQDSALKQNHFLFGINLNYGIEKMNFSALHNDPYLLDQPNNYTLQTITSIFLGNPNNNFVSIYGTLPALLPFALSINRDKKGNFNNYNIKASGAPMSYGILFNHCFYSNDHRKFIKAIYGSLGMNHITEVIVSNVSGKGKLNADTTFIYEYSKARNFLIGTEITLDLLHLGKRTTLKFPLLLKLGYNFPFQKTQWKNQGTVNGYMASAQPNVGLGGFTASIGILAWYPKGVFKKKQQEPKKQ